jgi:hypothetical protein
MAQPESLSSAHGLALPPRRFSILRRGGFPIVRVVLGLLLLTAAGLKAYDVVRGSGPRWSLFSSPRSQIAVIEVETILGVWLLSGWSGRAAWGATLGLFGILACISLHLGLTGQPSCGCFGRVEVQPWLAFAVDIAALVALVVWRPHSRLREPSSTRLSKMLRTVVVTGVVLALLGGTFVLPPAPDLLVPSPRKIDMGKVPALARRKVTFSLANMGNTPAAVAKVESSCHCLTIDLDRCVIAPGEQILAHANLDLSREPSFAGNLGIDVRGLTSTGQVLFDIVVEVAVLP